MGESRELEKEIQTESERERKRALQSKYICGFFLASPGSTLSTWKSPCFLLPPPTLLTQTGLSQASAEGIAASATNAKVFHKLVQV